MTPDIDCPVSIKRVRSFRTGASVKEPGQTYLRCLRMCYLSLSHQASSQHMQDLFLPRLAPTTALALS